MIVAAIGKDLGIVQHDVCACCNQFLDDLATISNSFSIKPQSILCA